MCRLKYVLDDLKNNNNEIDLEIRKKISKIYIGLKLIKFYIPGRMLLSAVFFMLEPYMITNKEFGCIMPKIKYNFELK